MAMEKAEIFLIYYSSNYEVSINNNFYYIIYNQINETAYVIFAFHTVRNHSWGLKKFMRNKNRFVHFLPDFYFLIVIDVICCPLDCELLKSCLMLLLFTNGYWFCKFICWWCISRYLCTVNRYNFKIDIKLQFYS